MKEWFLYASISLILWGLYAFLPKISNQHISPQSILIFQVIGNIIVSIIVLFTIKFSPNVHSIGSSLAIISGIAGLTGTLFFLLAMSKHPLTVVVTFTALYPIITIALSYFFLNEIITIKQGLGMIFAIIAIILFYS